MPTRAAKKTTQARAAKKATAPRAAKKKATSPRAAKEAKPAPTKSTPTRAAKKAAPARAVATRLETYRAMRDFERTPEPAGGAAPSPEHALSFVIQKHAASHLHYDFRLELEGVLLSWSVPKGPSLRPGERRLAVRTEDHPLEYASFEGVIPKGEYGGGTVIVWDRGTWSAEGDARKAVDKGKLTFTLAGDKLRGRFHLARTKPSGDKREHWLLFKGNDEAADKTSDVVAERPESALSGRTIEEVAAAPDRVWHSNRTEKKAPGAKRARASEPATAPADPAPSESGQDVLALVKRLPLRFGLTNLDKVLYPEQNVRKAELIAYYASVASHALPYVGGRPLMLVRCPHGHGKKCFYQKHANEGVPDVVQRKLVREGDKAEECMAVTDLDGLVALAQLGALEIHTWMCHLDSVEQPDQLVFDLDPDEGLGWDQVVEAAHAVRTRLEELELESFVKTTGGKGLHVVVPVARKLDWDAHKGFSKAVAESLARARPDRYVTNMSKTVRRGKLFLDYLRNGRGATAVAPYSTRAREGATVSTPISWDELARGARPADFTIYSVMKRLGQGHVDPWKDMLRSKQTVGAKALRSLGIR